MSAVIEISLNAYSRHRIDFPELLKPSLETLDISRQCHLEIILKSLETSSLQETDHPGTRHDYSVNLECLVGYPDLLFIHPQHAESQYSKIVQCYELIIILVTSRLSTHCNHQHSRHEVADEESPVAKKGVCSFEYLSVRLAKLELELGSMDSELHPSLTKAITVLDKCE